MKKRLLTMLLACCILLSGCASMLEREAVSVTPHNSTKTDEGTESILRVENYQELVNALISFINAGQESGTIRLYMDSAQVDDSLREARLEVMNEFPLGAYAVYKIEYEVDPLVTYSEARFHFIYRRTQHQIAAITSASGISAIRSELASALAGFTNEKVLRITYFDQNEEFLLNLARQAYYNAPATALEYPKLEVHLYPNSGLQRIAEITFTYELTQEQLTERAALLEQACQLMLQDIPVSEDHTQQADRIVNAVLSRCTHSESGGSSAYHALLENQANSEGLALTMALLCEKLSLPCKVARGILNGEPHFWNVVSTDDGWRHIDLTQSGSPSFHTDAEWLEAGYLWEQISLPVCN